MWLHNVYFGSNENALSQNKHNASYMIYFNNEAYKYSWGIIIYELVRDMPEQIKHTLIRQLLGSCLIRVCLIFKWRFNASPVLNALTHCSQQLVSHFSVIANKSISWPDSSWGAVWPGCTLFAYLWPKKKHFSFLQVQTILQFEEDCVS